MSTSPSQLGKQVELKIVKMMRKEGLSVTYPVVGGKGIDALVKKSNGQDAEIQIMARGEDVKDGHAALFAAITHVPRKNYWFVFYSMRLDTILILSSKEFVYESSLNTDGKNVGKRTIKFNGNKNGAEYILERFEKYIAKDFSRIVTGATECMLKKVFLISCAKRQRDYRCEAQFLYAESPMFRESLEYARSVVSDDAIFVLSTKHHLVPLNKPLDPYDQPPEDEKGRAEWGTAVIKQIESEFDLPNTKFVILFRDDHCEELTPHLPHKQLPLKGLTQGKRLPKVRELLFSGQKEKYGIKEEVQPTE